MTHSEVSITAAGSALMAAACAIRIAVAFGRTTPA